MQPVPPISTDVARAVALFPAPVVAHFERMRTLVFEVASSSAGVGVLTETLRWGEPAWLTLASKSGSTVRFGWKAQHAAQFGLYFNCNTTLVDGFRTRFPELRYEGNRALLLAVAAPLPEDAVRACISSALTYHLDKRGTRAARARRLSR